MAHPNEVLVRGAFAAFGRGDMDALQQYWAETSAGTPPALAPRGGLRGHRAGSTVIRPARRADGQHDHRRAARCGRQRRARRGDVYPPRRASGQQWEDNTVQVIRILDGKASEIWNYPADQYGLGRVLLITAITQAIGGARRR